MKKYIGIVIIILLSFSCKNVGSKESEVDSKQDFLEIVNDDYELISPSKNSKAVLVLFGGYPESPADVKEQFKILPIAKKNNVAVLIMNYNQKLYLSEEEKLQLANQLRGVLSAHKLPVENLFIGGFSSGGNVSLLLGAYLSEHTNLGIKPKGVFIADSPIDLSALYFTSEKNIERNFSEVSVQESTWIIKTLGEQFGDPNVDISKYEQYSVFTSKTSNIKNLEGLKNIKLRLYTEPDTLWWKENRMADYDQMNAYYIKKLSETLDAHNFKDVQYIETKNRGYRANGERHPHSWAIIDEMKLMQWILAE